jgi:hypothetical protein
MELRRHALAVAFMLVFLRAFSLDSASGNSVVVRAPSLGDGPVYLTVNLGELIDLSPGPVCFGAYPVLLKRTGIEWEFRAVASGHTQVIAGSGAQKRTILVFVTPTPSRQVERLDLEWYRTQFGAGVADCGPALVSMSILWARGKDVSVQDIRTEIGYPFANGATSFADLRVALDRHRVVWRTTPVRAVSDLIAVLKRGHLALMLIRSGGIARVKGDPRRDLIGRYYDYKEGHYVLAKGYSIDRSYFVVYDPYPADWDDNSLRYEDGTTMIGKNRYYPADQVLAALKAGTVLEVSQDRANTSGTAP